MKKNLSFFLTLLLLSISWISFGQQKTITGRVVDSANEPLPGVTVVLKGTSQGTVTNFDGNFTLPNVAEDAIVVFSFVGMKSQELPVAGTTTFNITLENDAIGIEEVVAVGYGSMRKSDLTGAVARVGGEDLQKVATADVVSTLQGKVAGVDVVSNSGEPGAGVKIRIRGVGSWRNSNPIYVVDGFPTDDISNVDPSNIESIEVLKDASATAIYGSRGANGVVLVTTKSGSKDNSKIEVNAYAGVQYTNERIPLTNATEFSMLRKEAFANAGRVLPVDELEILDYVIANNYKGTDWQDEMLGVAPIQNYSIKALGGTDKISYNVGATLFMQEGIVDNSGMDKLFVWANNDYELSEKVTLSTNISYSTYKKNNHNDGAYSGALPVAIRLDPITAAWDDYTNNYGARFLSGVSVNNPAIAVDEAEYQTRGEHKLVGNFTLNIDDLFTKGLSFKTMYAADLKFANTKNYYPQFYVAPDQKRDESQLYQQKATGVSWAWNGFFNYVKTIDEHHINAMVGAEAQEFIWDDIWAQGFDVPADEDLMFLGLARNQEQKDLGGGKSRHTLASYFARANYSFGNKYLFTATMRADGSSKFKGSNKWGYFPSFSAGWNVKEEGFMDDADWLDRLKLRAGWGQVGNEGSIGNYDYVTTMVTGYTYVVGGGIVDGAVAKKTANPDIKWETSEQLNVGADFSFLSQRLDLSVDYFNRKTRDLLLDKPIPFYVGAQRPSVNAGTMENNGFDVSLNWHEDKNSGFSYSVGVNISKVSNKVTDLAGGEPFAGGSVPKLGSVTRTEAGEELAYFYGLQTDGIINDQTELDAYLNDVTSSVAELGDVKFIDQNGDGKIDDLDKIKLGSAFPDFTAGMNLDMSYKGFDFKAFIYASVGNEIVNGHAYWIQTSGILSNYSTDRLDRWTADNPSANEPRMVSNDPNQNWRFSDRYVEDGTYVRLRNVQLGYTLPKDFVEKMKLSNMRIYVSADNLLTFTDYSGWNPEIASYGGALGGGVDYATYPVPVIINGGVNLTF
nr:TonB-dependent receptor [uncultured Draconibacterium sp.]